MKQILKITLFLLLYSSLGLLNSALAQSSWKTHFEDGKVKIEYRIADCSDRVNDTDFSYYVMRFVNKTKSQLNVQFDTSKKVDSTDVEIENFNSFILKPSEIREGNCNSKEREVRFFAKNSKDIKNISDEKPLLILNIKTYEL